MAKGLRSSTKKTNRAKLRRRVFGPVEDARTERLSNKVLEIASKPRSKKDIVMNIDESSRAENGSAAQKRSDPETTTSLPSESVMELDDITCASKTAARASLKTVHTPKKRRGKANASMAFPIRQKGKRQHSSSRNSSK